MCSWRRVNWSLILLGEIISPFSDVRDWTATSTAFRFSSVAFSGHLPFRCDLLLANSSSSARSCAAAGVDVAAAGTTREMGLLAKTSVKFRQWNSVLSKISPRFWHSWKYLLLYCPFNGLFANETFPKCYMSSTIRLRSPIAYWVCIEIVSVHWHGDCEVKLESFE